MTEYRRTTLCFPTQDKVQALKTEKLTPFLKWAGGKEQELKHILPLVPSFDTYYEPFVGGGAVFFSLRPQKSFINDKSPELMNLYRMIAYQDKDFLDALDILLSSWQAISKLIDKEAVNIINVYKQYSMNILSEKEMEATLLEFIERHADEFKGIAEAVFSKNGENFHHELKRNLLSKTKRMKTIENKKWQLSDCDIIANTECALKSAFYMHLRYLYNNIQRYNIPLNLSAAIFFFVRENAYASMFRYNSQGEFNVPYGGLSYNRKDLTRKISYMRSPGLRHLLSNTVIENTDFEDFLLKHNPQSNDFIFLDPPYDSEFSTYAKNEFTMQDQERLANYLIKQCKAKFMLVIKHTSFIFELYNQADLSIRAFDKKYLVSFQDRNDRNVEHLIITNY